MEQKVGAKQNKLKWVEAVGEVLGFVIGVWFMFLLVPGLGFVIDDLYRVWLPYGFWAAVLSMGFKSVKHLA